MTQKAADQGCSIITSSHLKFKRLLGEYSCILCDQERSEWILLVDFRSNSVIFHKYTDSMITDTEILENLKFFVTGMYWSQFQIIFIKLKLKLKFISSIRKSQKIEKWVFHRPKIWFKTPDTLWPEVFNFDDLNQIFGRNVSHQSIKWPSCWNEESIINFYYKYGIPSSWIVSPKISSLLSSHSLWISLKSYKMISF